MSNFKALETYLNIRALSENNGGQVVCVLGKSESGKTKLLRAVEGFVSEAKPTLRVTYLSAGDFIRRLVDAIYQGSLPDFTAEFTRTDLLLLDDVHVIAGRKSLEHELFGLLDRLLRENKQVVLSARSAPEALLHLDSRLRQLLEAGLKLDLN